MAIFGLLADSHFLGLLVTYWCARVKNIFPRIVSLLLAACFLADPTLAAALSQQQILCRSAVVGSSQNIFKEEAFDPPHEEVLRPILEGANDFVRGKEAALARAPEESAAGKVLAFFKGLWTWEPAPLIAGASGLIEETAGFLALAAMEIDSRNSYEETMRKIWQVYRYFRKQYPPLVSAQLTQAMAMYNSEKFLEFPFGENSIDDIIGKTASTWGKPLPDEELGMATITVIAWNKYIMQDHGGLLAHSHWKVVMGKFPRENPEARPFLGWAYSYPDAGEDEVWSMYRGLLSNHKPRIAALLTVSAMRRKPKESRSGYRSTHSSSSGGDYVSSTLGALASLLSIMITLEEMNHPPPSPEAVAREKYDTLKGQGLDPDTAALVSVGVGANDVGRDAKVSQNYFQSLFGKVQQETSPARSRGTVVVAYLIAIATLAWDTVAFARGGRGMIGRTPFLLMAGTFWFYQAVFHEGLGHGEFKRWRDGFWKMIGNVLTMRARVSPEANYLDGPESSLSGLYAALGLSMGAVTILFKREWNNLAHPNSLIEYLVVALVPTFAVVLASFLDRNKRFPFGDAWEQEHADRTPSFAA